MPLPFRVCFKIKYVSAKGYYNLWQAFIEWTIHIKRPIAGTPRVAAYWRFQESTPYNGPKGGFPAQKG